MKKYLWTVFCFFAAVACAHSGALRFERVSLKSGLSQATILDMQQDRQGFMWLATQDGLNRYDGYDFVVFRHSNTDANSLSDNYVNNIFEDDSGDLWLTTRNGLNRFDPRHNRFTRFFYDVADPYSLSANWTFGVNQDKNGRIWVGTYESGINVYDPHTGRFSHYLNVKNDSRSLSDNGIYDIFVDSKGTVWVATRNGGVNRFNAHQNDFTRFVHDEDNPYSISHNKVYRIYEDSKGILWFATRGGGLNRFDAKTERFYHYRHAPGLASSISDDEVWSIAEMDNGDLLVGTFTGGLNRLRRGADRFERIVHDPGSEESLPGNSVISSYRDASGIFWFGVRDIGLAIFDPELSVFNHYYHQVNEPSSLSDNSVQSFLETRAGEILVATREGGINLFDSGSGHFSPLQPPDSPAYRLLTRPINQMAEDSDGNIWISFKNDGVAKFDRRTKAVTNYRHIAGDETSLSNDAVNMLVFDPKGRLWLATRNGLDLFDPVKGQVIRVYRHSEQNPASLNSDWVSTVFIDAQETVWVGTQRGIARLKSDGHSFERFEHDPLIPGSLSSNSVMSLYEDAEHHLWVATTSGLNRFDSASRTFSHIKQEHGLSNDQVYGVLQDNSGKLWLMTNYGLNLYDPLSGDIRLYTQQDGLQNNEFNQGAYYKLSDGRLLFGGVNGFNLIDPDEVKDNPYAPKVRLTALRIFNRPVKVGQTDEGAKGQVVLSEAINYVESLTLDYPESVFSFEFAALHYAAPSRNQYAYRLEGFDRQWNYTDFKNRRATYTNLEPGNYVFEVKASNKDGVWNEQPTQLPLTILSPWWLSSGAKFLWLGLIFTAIATLYRIKTRQIRRQKAELQLQVTRQVAQVVAQKQALERSYHDIKVISAIGQKINASLDLEKVLWSVYEHINQLMDGTVFGIGLYQPEKNIIQVELAVEMGNRYKPYTRSMENKNQFPVWCIDHNEVVFVNDLELDGRKYLERHEYDEYEKNRVYLEDGAYAGPPQSLIYVPINSADRILGFITVQSFSRHAYQEVHVDILKTLAVYTGTAIVNSIEHRRLMDSRRELIESEKMASLGMLVAGVAHEINTPVGNCLTATTSLEIETERLFEAKEQGKLTEQRLDTFGERLNEGFALIVRNLKQVGNLISHFKDVAVNPAVEISTTFNVRKLLIETIQELQPKLDKRHVRLDLLCDDDFEIHTCATSLSRVVNTLISNSLLHAFEGIGRKKISIFVTIDGDEVQLRYVDNGKGMSDELSSHVFEPFYTTKRDDGCLGLGMHMVYNLVTQSLHGTVRCDSDEGQGMQVTISIAKNN